MMLWAIAAGVPVLPDSSVEGATEGIEQHTPAEAPAPAVRAETQSLQERVSRLEERVAHLEREIEGLRKVNSL